MKKIPFLILFVFAFSKEFQAQSVDYTVTDFSQNLSPFKISATVALEAILPQYGFLIQGTIGKRLGYSATYRRNMSKFLFMADQDEVGNPEDIKTGQYFEADVDFLLTDKSKAGAKAKITTESNVYSEKSFIARVNKRRQWGLHGSFFTYNRPYFTGANPNEGNLITLSQNNIDFVPNGTSYGSNMRNFGLSAGIVFKKTKKSTVHADGWNHFFHQGFRFYVDALFGITSFEDVVVNSVRYEARATDSTPIGYRLGFEWDQMGVVTRLELGSRPGVQFLYPFYNYWNLNFSFNLYGGDKRYGMKSKK